MKQLGSEEARRRYGPNWEEVVAYIEAIPFGFMLNNAGEPNARDSTVRRVCSLEELEQVVYFDSDAGCPANSRYLRFLLNLDHRCDDLKRVARERGLAQELENAWHDAGTEYADKTESFADWFWKWSGGVFLRCSRNGTVIRFRTMLPISRGPWSWGVVRRRRSFMRCGTGTERVTGPVAGKATGRRGG